MTDAGLAPIAASDAADAAGDVSAEVTGDAAGDEAAAPAALWETARYYLGWLLSVVGAPVAVLAMGVLTPRERAEILDWLRPVEALARRLLLAEAAALANSHASPPRRHAPAPRPRSQPAALDPEHPQTWRAPFRVSAEGRSRAARAARLSLSPTDGLLDAAPVAARIEAVNRVLEDPAPFVRRLATRLAARLTRNEAHALAPLTKPPRFRPRRRRRVVLGSEALAYAAARAQTALAAFDTS